MALLSLRDVQLAFGGPPLFTSLTLHIQQGERLCLLGRNGTGKSTLLKVLSGELSVDDGVVERSRGLRVGVLRQQVPNDADDSTVAQVVRGGVSAEVGEEQARLRVRRVLSQASLPPEPAFGSLSAGWKRRVLLARALAGQPDVLLLDEPTNHLDIPAIDWLEDFVRRHVTTCLFVSHDRVFVDRLATRIVELDRGEIYSFPGSYKQYQRRKEQALANEQVHHAALDKKLAREEIWLRRGVKARRARNEGRVRALKELRAKRRARREQIGQARLRVQQADRSGKVVIKAEGLAVTLGDKPVLRDVSTIILRGDKVGIIGPNGCGKTTLVRALLGNLTPDGGTVEQGT
ncbi:MAG TPA: ATP-binding cassette domain-containing protein, partial [Sorangium sp.]|nr:ATP-binding cassette domain-containing protein [Sorangium sp.]